MKSPDRFLIAMVVGMIVLILVGLGVALFQEGPTYRAEDTPENVAYNYLLALYLDEAERAFSDLARASNPYEDVDEFRTATRRELGFRYNENSSFGIEIINAMATKTGVTVAARVDVYSSYPTYSFWQWESNSFDSTTIDLELVQNEAGVWQITGTTAD